MRLLFPIVLPGLASCAANPCVTMCQQYQRWLDDCATTWEAEFGDRDWASIDDCYDDAMDAGPKGKVNCEQEARDWESKDCY